MIEPGRHLAHAQAERGCDAEHGPEYGEKVDGMADGTVDLVADDRVERRAQRQRQLLAEPEIGQAQADDHVDRPAVESPVEVGDTHGENRAGLVHVVDTGLIGKRIVRVAPGHGVVEIEQRFGDAEEQQPDADAGREQHREPGKGAELPVCCRRRPA